MRPLAALAFAAVLAQPAGFNYDEAKVPSYTLPDPLVMANGERVTTPAQWTTRRRPELLALFASNVYGYSPGRPDGMRFVTRETGPALGGSATRKQVSILLDGTETGPRMDLLIFVPAAASASSREQGAISGTGARDIAPQTGAPQTGGPQTGVSRSAQGRRVPVFLGLSFSGNHAVHDDPAIALSTRWIREGGKGVVAHRATDASRGSEASRWPVATIISRGYGLVTAYYGDLEPDHPDGWKEGVRAHFKGDAKARAGQSKATGTSSSDASQASGSDWGALAAWAWGMSRALDYLETDPDIDATRVAVIGHSRIGKAAVWAGAQDTRFAMVVSNESGEGGAAITRRKFGETIARINTAFPHWFCGNYKQYNDREEALPVDFHQLLALIAPTPLYIASAAEDLWADPRGEFLSGVHAGPVYRLLGEEGLGVSEMPAVDTPVGKTIGYHVRRGKHDVTSYDWDQFLSFADRHLKGQ